MGIFDVFTGNSAKEAASKNSQLLQDNQTSGTNTLTTGQNNAIGALNTSSGLYGNLASKYGGATSLALDALGVNGSDGNSRATSAFQSSPGYQYSVDQSLQNLLRTANASGGSGVASGNTLSALSDRAGNMANQEYSNWLSNLNSYVSPELSATSGQASSEASKSPVYTSTAKNISDLGTSTTNGITNQNTQAANAETQGSSNLWNLGLNLAKLGVEAATGGTSLLGGSSGGGTASTISYGGKSWPSYS